MPYVQRENGVIVGVFANPQKGFAEEELPDTDAEVIAFNNPPEAPPVPTIEDRLAYLEKGIGAVVAKGTITKADIDVASPVAADATVDPNVDPVKG